MADDPVAALTDKLREFERATTVAVTGKGDAAQNAIVEKIVLWNQIVAMFRVLQDVPPFDSQDLVYEMLHERIRKAGSLRAAARFYGVSAPYLHDVVRCNRLPGEKLCRAMGIIRRVETKITYDLPE